MERVRLGGDGLWRTDNPQGDSEGRRGVAGYHTTGTDGSPFERGGTMELIWTAVVGFAVGVIAKLLMPGRDPGGMILTILLGIAGAFVAGIIGRMAGWYSPDSTPGLIASVLGAMALLWLYRLSFTRRKLL
jgi:uncharacterized membrane protein YeaQ/YmgE (transglycosylase-associated protein family)